MMRSLFRTALLGAAALHAPVLSQETAEEATSPTSAPAVAVAEEAKAPPTVALVRPSGQYADLAEQGADLTALLLGGGGGKVHAFYDFVAKIAALREAPGEHVLFDLSRPFGLNTAQLAEVERAIAEVRAAGKHTWAYVEGADLGTYQVAAACDRILIADLGVIDLPAPAMAVTFLKDAFDVLGIHMDVIRCGDFKGAVEPFLYSQMSDHLRAHYTAMLESINNSIVERIARGRKMSATQVRTLQAQRMFTAEQAVECGLADEIVPWRGAEHAFEAATHRSEVAFDDVLSGKKERKSVNLMAMLSQMFNPKKAAEIEEPTLVVLHLSGDIVDGAQPTPGSIVSGPTVAAIDALKQQENVKGVVVRINSPGGSATASEAILLALRDLAAAKPVVVSMGRVAGSGGYYITCFGRPILAEAATITGSIGVFGAKPSLGALMRRIGVHQDMVALDASAGMMSIDRPWTDAEKQRMQGFVDKVYDVFVGHVARSRGMTTGEVLAIAGGRVYSGLQAVENGLVDRIGGLEDAIAMVAKEADLGEDVTVQHVPQPRDFFETIAQQMFDVSVWFQDARQRVIARRLDLGPALRIVLDGLQGERPTLVWAMVPDALTLR